MHSGAQRQGLRNLNRGHLSVGPLVVALGVGAFFPALAAPVPVSEAGSALGAYPDAGAGSRVHASLDARHASLRRRALTRDRHRVAVVGGHEATALLHSSAA